jgi:N-acetylneuraminic acid mutarotase
LHIIGGYGEGRVDRGYHHVYNPATDVWYNAAALPRGANHVAVVTLNGRIYAFGGFTEQNRNPDANAYVYDVGRDQWQNIAPMPRPRGAAAAVALNGKVQLVGGASSPTEERASVGWHEVYEPQTDNWELRAPLPTARSGHGMVVYRDRFFAMGGEGGIINQAGQQTVFGQMESYDPKTDTWLSHGAMPTPRHAVGAVAIGDWIYVAGGGAVLGGSVQSAVHEAFSLSM